MATRIKNIRHLQQRINKAKTECRDMENELDKRLEYLQDNYMGMAANSALYGLMKSPKNFTVLKDIFTGVWKAESIKEFFKKTALRFLHAIAVKLGFKIVRDFAEGKMNHKEDEETTVAEEPKENQNKEE
tara:strand:- start:266 stop:655 length:390 start_codon:yes stop_codon:yes gene_type:complete